MKSLNTARRLNNETPQTPKKAKETEPWAEAAKEFRERLLALPLTNGDPQVLKNYSTEVEVEQANDRSCKVVNFVGAKKIETSRPKEDKPLGSRSVSMERVTEQMEVCYLAAEVRNLVEEVAGKHGVKFRFNVSYDGFSASGPSIPAGCDFKPDKVSLEFSK